VPSTFETDTAPRPSEDGEALELVLDPGWWAGAGPNGGYLAAGLLRAIRQRRPEAGPLRDVDAAFLEPADAGVARVHVETLREGGSVTVARARLSQDGTLAATLRATFGAAREGPGFVAEDPPTGRVPEGDWGRQRPPGVEAPTFTQHCRLMPAGGALPLAGEPGEGMRAWLAMADPTPMSEALVVFLADAWMPALYAVLDEPAAVPSLDLAVQVDHVPDDHGDQEPLLGSFRAEQAREGYVAEDGTLWTPDGDLVARARQTRRVLG
jgi:acyl-CoA thioesterase